MKNTILKIAALILLVAVMCASFTACEPTYDVYVVDIEVESFGIITVRLNHKSAPATVKNFLKLVDEDFYDGLTFHRAQKNFVIQGGCPKGDGTGNSSEFIKGEFSANGFVGNNIRHEAGVISMARGNTMDSASCQFFITIGDARSSLDGNYAGFGYVNEESMEVVYAIAEAMYPYTSGQYGTISLTYKDKQPVIKDIRVVDQYNLG